MFSSQQLDEILKNLQNQLNTQSQGEKKPKSFNNNNNTAKLTTTQILAILALLAGTLEVTSVVIDRDQAVQLVLSGTLKKEKENPLDEVVTQLGNLPFEEVMKAMFNRFK